MGILSDEPARRSPGEGCFDRSHAARASRRPRRSRPGAPDGPRPHHPGRHLQDHPHPRRTEADRADHARRGRERRGNRRHPQAGERGAHARLCPPGDGMGGPRHHQAGAAGGARARPAPSELDTPIARFRVRRDRPRRHRAGVERGARPARLRLPRVRRAGDVGRPGQHEHQRPLRRPAFRQARGLPDGPRSRAAHRRDHRDRHPLAPPPLRRRPHLALRRLPGHGRRHHQPPPPPRPHAAPHPLGRRLPPHRGVRGPHRRPTLPARRSTSAAHGAARPAVPRARRLRQSIVERGGPHRDRWLYRRGGRGETRGDLRDRTGAGRVAGGRDDARRVRGVHELPRRPERRRQEKPHRGA